MTTPDSTTPTKLCTKCGTEYPATAEYFFRANKRKDGLQRWCKTCHTAHCRDYKRAHPEETRARKRAYYRKDVDASRAHNRAYYAAHKDRIQKQMAGYRANLTDEQRARRREYDRLYMAEWRRKNPDKTHEANKRNYARHSDRHKAHARQWERDNPERFQARRRAYDQTEARKQKNRERVKQWQISHPDQYREQQRLALARRRARVRNAPGSFTSADLAAVRAAQTDKQGRLICWACGKPIKGTPHLDHWIPLDKAGANDAGNLHYMHARCNLTKSAKHPTELGRLI